MSSFDDSSVMLGRALRKAGLSMSVAESCTGGLLGHAITNTTGSSDYFLGGVVTYSDESKVNVLGVNPETLEKAGAVSEECVREMAGSVQKLFSSDLSVAISGIAGPEGGTDEKPVGTVFIAILHKDIIDCYQELFDGDRNEIKTQTCLNAMELILNQLIKD